MKRVAAVLAAGMLLSIPVPAQVDLRGIVAAWVAANQRIDVRLVKETKGTDLVEKIRAHVKAQGYFIVDGEPDAQVRAAHDRMASLSVAETITGAFRTPVTNPEARGVVESVQKAFDTPPVQLRTLGGTVPIAQFIDALGFPAILAPTVNFDNNQHEDNENLRLGHLFQAIEIIAAILRS